MMEHENIEEEVSLKLHFDVYVGATSLQDLPVAAQVYQVIKD